MEYGMICILMHQSGRVASSQLRLKILDLLKRNCKHLHGQAPVVSKLLGPLSPICSLFVLQKTEAVFPGFA